MNLKIPLISLITLLSFWAKAQDKKALNFFKRGDEAFKERSYATANLFFEKAIERYPEYALAYYKMGQIAYAARKSNEAKEHYQKLLELEPGNEKYVLAYTFLGNDFLKNMEYAKAKEYLAIALSNTREGTRAAAQLEKQINTCTYALEILANPLVIKPEPMPQMLNFKDKQYFPAFTADGSAIYFTARSNGSDEDIYISTKNDTSWSAPKNLSDIINTNLNEGTCTISADAKTMVFTVCEGARQGFGSCDLFITRRTEKGWSEPENMGQNVNSPEWDSQATLSADGKTLVFSSARYGGSGGKDLYVSTLGGMNEWSKARNLGTVINTGLDEVSPFLHANGTTLFFASNGHVGLGGYDIFLTDRQNKQFTKPENLGYPINDGSDQFSMVISADGQNAYYSKEVGDQVDLYQFSLPKELKEKFNPTFYLKGIVADAESNLPLGAEIQLVDLSSKEVISTFSADSKTGEYLAVLPFSGNYGLYVEHPEYFFKSLAFSFNSEAKKSNKELLINLEKIDKGKVEVLNNIYFDEASWELKSESLVELSKLAALIWRNPKLKVEISGHTDDIGSPEANLSLSEKRAQSVVAYLSNEGLDIAKLTAKGYGETAPRVSNDTAENRALNRRIELRFF